MLLVFIATLRPNKGLEGLIDAIEVLRNESFLLMIVGTDEDNYCQKLKQRVENSILKDRVMFFPQKAFEILPEFLSITDLAVIPQAKRAASRGQVPAKIFDAMAMAKLIIATNVSDIPEILGGCGQIVEYENSKRLAETIKYIFDHPTEAAERGLKARERCRGKYGWGAIEKVLVKVFSKYE